MNTIKKQQQRDVVGNNIGCLLNILPVECVGIITKAALIQCKHINMKKTSSQSANETQYKYGYGIINPLSRGWKKYSEEETVKLMLNITTLIALFNDQFTLKRCSRGCQNEFLEVFF